MKNDKHNDAAVSHTRHADRTRVINRRGAPATRRRSPDWRALLVTLAAAVSLAATPGLHGFTSTAMAESMIHVGATPVKPCMPGVAASETAAASVTSSARQS